MTVYMVERNLKGIAMDDLAGAQKLAIATAQDMTREGTPVRYIRSTFAPEDGRCMCLFEAGSAGDVQRLPSAPRPRPSRGNETRHPRGRAGIADGAAVLGIAPTRTGDSKHFASVSEKNSR